MAGGSDAGFARAQPLFEIMGQKSVHCGKSGAGQAALNLQNMILGITMIGTWKPSRWLINWGLTEDV